MTMQRHQFVELFDYSYWAFDRIWPAIDKLSDAQFAADLSYSLGSVRNIVVHLISGHRRWLARLQGTPIPPHLRFEDFPSRREVRAEWDKARAEMLEYVGSLSEERLTQPVPHAMPDRGVEAAPQTWKILLHLVNHSTDHRSQILALLNVEFAIPTPEHDFIIYLREHGGRRTGEAGLAA